MGQHMRIQLGQVVKCAAAAADLLHRRRGLVILAYHRVGGRTPVSVDLPRALFRDQLDLLVVNHDPISMERAADLLVGSQPPGGPPAVAVTFDDGTADFVDEALPELEARGVPATLYVATHHVETGAPFPDGGRPISWAALRDAAATGLVAIGSHTHSHRLLDRVDGLTAADELDRSVGLVEERLGTPCRHFAYPKALLGSPPAEDQVRRRFRTAAVAGTRPNRYGHADLHRLARSPVQASDGTRWFRHKAMGGMALENDLRDMYNRRRYRGLAR